MSADISRLRQKISLLRTQRAGLEDKALRSQAMVRGSLLELMRKCGKPSCKCQRGELHGPNFYLSLPKPGKRSRMVPVPPDKVKAIRSVNSHYHEFQHALTEIRRLNEGIESLLLAIREEQLRLGEEKAELPGLPPA
ncbi:MAG: hypothetical protein Q7R34_09470 [Dehalococcoidia bacterium]|nr:hypothetical protein [Dehalococcoidia bacterium]